MKTSNLAGLDTLLNTEKGKKKRLQRKFNLKMKLRMDTMITEGMLHTEVMKIDSAAEAAIIIKKIAEATNAELILLGRIEKGKKGSPALIIERVEVIRKVDINAEEAKIEAIANMAPLVEIASMGANVSMVAMGSNVSMETIVAIIRDVNVRTRANDSIKSKSIPNQITESFTATTRSFS